VGPEKFGGHTQVYEAKVLIQIPPFEQGFGEQYPFGIVHAIPEYPFEQSQG